MISLTDISKPPKDAGRPRRIAARLRTSAIKVLACLAVAGLLGGCNQVAPSVVAPQLIAHAGGGLDGHAYLNSKQALDANYARGLRMFEMDFNQTSDGHLAAIHDWNATFSRLFGDTSSTAPTLSAFLALPMKDGHTQLDLQRLAEWLRSHPDAYIVTDIKGGNIAGLTQIVEEIPDVASQFIPQIYKQQEYQPAMKLGFKTQIYTLYASKDTPEQVAEFARTHSLLAITTNLQRPGVEKLLALLEEDGQFVYLHTLNDLKQVQQLLSGTVDGVYTDFLEPAQLAETAAP